MFLVVWQSLFFIVDDASISTLSIVVETSFGWYLSNEQGPQFHNKLTMSWTLGSEWLSFVNFFNITYKRSLLSSLHLSPLSKIPIAFLATMPAWWV